jgi:hypothetical protein
VRGQEIAITAYKHLCIQGGGTSFYGLDIHPQGQKLNKLLLVSTTLLSDGQVLRARGQFTCLIIQAMAIS